ncbi:MAG: competence protein ComK [Bacilli bacterium]
MLTPTLNFVRNYIFILDTLVLLPIQLEDGHIVTRVIERQRELLVALRPQDIIEASCVYYGASMEDQIQLTRKHISDAYKLPICLCSKQQMIVFPTTGYQHPDCVWINLSGISHIQSTTHSRVLILFQNNQTIQYPMAFKTFSRQWERAGLLANRLFHQPQKLTAEVYDVTKLSPDALPVHSYTEMLHRIREQEFNKYSEKKAKKSKTPF